MGTAHVTTMYAGPNIPVFLLMVWLPLIGLVTVVYLVAYGIAYKRRGLIAAGASVFAAMVGLGAILALLVAYQTSASQSSMSLGSNSATLTATANRSEEVFPGIVSMFSGGAFHFDGFRISIGQIMLVAVLALVAIRVFSRRAQSDAAHDCHRGWGLGRFILVVLVIMFFVRAASHEKDRSARDAAQLSQQQAEHDRREMERARRHAPMMANQTPLMVQTSIEQLWDKLNQPKIDLHAGESVGGAKLKAADSASNRSAAESLAHSAAELGRALALVSNLSQQVSDASRLVARSLVAVDSPNDTSLAAADVPPPATTIPQTKSPSKHQSAPIAKPVVAKQEVKPAGSDVELNEKIGGETPTNKPRPAWVEEQQKQVGNVLRQVVHAGPYATPEECYAKTDELLKMATDDYVKQNFGGVRDDRLAAMMQAGSPHVTINNFKSAALDRMDIGVSYIRHEIAKDEYMETVERSVGPMKNLHTLLEFTPDVDRDLRVRWNEFQRDARLTAVGLLSGSVLGMIGLAFGLLKVDTATKGYYSKRLFLGVPAAIIGVVTLAAAFGRW